MSEIKRQLMERIKAIHEEYKQKTDREKMAELSTLYTWLFHGNEQKPPEWIHERIAQLTRELGEEKAQKAFEEASLREYRSDLLIY